MRDPCQVLVEGHTAAVGEHERVQCHYHLDFGVAFLKGNARVQELVVVPVQPVLVLNVQRLWLQHLRKHKHFRPAAGKADGLHACKEVVGVARDAACDAQRLGEHQNFLVRLFLHQRSGISPASRHVELVRRLARTHTVACPYLLHHLSSLCVIDSEEVSHILRCEPVRRLLHACRAHKVRPPLPSELSRVRLELLPGGEVADDHGDPPRKRLPRHLPPALALGERDEAVGFHPHLLQLVRVHRAHCHLDVGELLEAVHGRHLVHVHPLGVHAQPHVLIISPEGLDEGARGLDDALARLQVGEDQEREHLAILRQMPCRRVGPGQLCANGQDLNGNLHTRCSEAFPQPRQRRPHLTRIPVDGVGPGAGDAGGLEEGEVDAVLSRRAWDFEPVRFDDDDGDCVLQRRLLVPRVLHSVKHGNRAILLEEGNQILRVRAQPVPCGVVACESDGDFVRASPLWRALHCHLVVFDELLPLVERAVGGFDVEGGVVVVRVDFDG
mmetsp:Transcript_28701/g.58729  ORF Transcript_28701/g.58729 Transcript_28701/m.58729 type:complete len:498 (+) Transcript_28701:774-2267(+)